MNAVLAIVVAGGALLWVWALSHPRVHFVQKDPAEVSEPRVTAGHMAPLHMAPAGATSGSNNVAIGSNALMPIVGHNATIVEP